MVKEPFDVEAAIKTYRLLITSSPPANQYLLLYVLDLLAVFSRESEKNLMPASSECLFIDSFFLSSNFLTSPDCLLLRSSHLSFLLSDLALIFQPESSRTQLTSPLQTNIKSQSKFLSFSLSIKSQFQVMGKTSWHFH